jgi:hypothetical protein
LGNEQPADDGTAEFYRHAEETAGSGSRIVLTTSP